MKGWLVKAYEKATRKVVAEAERHPLITPYYPVNGKYVDLMMPKGLLGWTGGFWPGLLWLVYDEAGVDSVKAAAKSATERLYEAVKDRAAELDHDVGFMYLLSAVRMHEISGDAEARSVGIAAADVLLGRMNAKGFVTAWNSCPYTDDVANVTIVDCMMNLPLLLWASKATGDDKYLLAAKRHADTCLTHVLREDGSSRHLVHFTSADSSEELVGQGYGVDTAWARGQGWAIYGYAAMYDGSGEARYLAAAEKTAGYVIKRLKKCRYVTPVDYLQPKSVRRTDSSAGAVTASALADLYRLTGKPLYRHTAEKLLRILSDKYADFGLTEDGILRGGTVAYHGGQPEGVRLIYGDYYYVEALLKLLKGAKV